MMSKRRMMGKATVVLKRKLKAPNVALKRKIKVKTILHQEKAAKAAKET